MSERKINYYWRLFATFLSFSLFGVGGLLMSVTIFPFLYILPIQKEKKIQLSRKAVRLSFRVFIGLMRLFGVLSYDIQGREKLSSREGLFIVANHPTLLDVVFLISIANLPNCVVKQAVRNNPFMFFVVRASGFIGNDGEPEDLIEQCEATLENGDGLILFPEGTRTDPDGDVVMKRGAAHIAIRAHKNLTPVLIQCTPITLTKKHSWYNIPKNEKMHYSICVKDDIKIESFLDLNGENAQNARALTDYIKSTCEGN